MREVAAHDWFAASTFTMLQKSTSQILRTTFVMLGWRWL
jgi:hypothetical protein